MTLTIFDLDETLISTDSDHSWGEYVADKGLVNPEEHRQKNEAFFADYKRGALDIDAYMQFSCSVLAQYAMEELECWRNEFFEQRIRPTILPKALALIGRHRARGDTLVVVTATIEFITAPIADALGIPNLIAPIPEIRSGRYTGKVVGIPSYREGKVVRIRQWLKDTGQSLEGSYCYSDSRNDLPMLELADFPHAVDPDPILKDIALARRWPIISLRD
ncbi:MAG: HAD family hydrolase [Pseudohongiellaceae bacterium]